jgi:hypothetical protein
MLVLIDVEKKDSALSTSDKSKNKNKEDFFLEGKKNILRTLCLILNFMCIILSSSHCAVLPYDSGRNVYFNPSSGRRRNI